MSKKIETARKMILDYIRETMLEKGITHKMVADKNGWQESNVSRMLSAKYPPTLDNFLMLCEAADCFMFLGDKHADNDLFKIMRDRWGKVNKN